MNHLGANRRVQVLRRDFLANEAERLQRGKFDLQVGVRGIVAEQRHQILPLLLRDLD